MLLLNIGLSRIVASSSSKMKHLVAAAPDQAYTVFVTKEYLKKLFFPFTLI